MSKFIFILAMLLPIFCLPQAGPDTLFDKHLYTSGEERLPYRLLQPLDDRSGRNFPLVIFLHGAGERGEDNEAQIRHIAALFLESGARQRFPCYVLAPQCPRNTMWAAHERKGGTLTLKHTPSPIMSLVLSLIDEIEKKYPVDRSRIYITGVSMGGFGTWELIGRFPDRFAAAVPICGGGDASTAPLISSVPIWAFHGSLDNVVAPQNSRHMIRAVRDAGGKPRYTEYPDVAHDSWVRAYGEPSLLPWLFTQRLEKKSGSK